MQQYKNHFTITVNKIIVVTNGKITTTIFLDVLNPLCLFNLPLIKETNRLVIAFKSQNNLVAKNFLYQVYLTDCITVL